MAELELRRRRRLRRKEIEGYNHELNTAFGVTLFSAEEAVDIAEAKMFELLLVNNRILAIVWREKVFPTVRGLLKTKPDRRFVTVDMGAVPFVCKGADIMNPGIVDADRGIEAGDIVWIKDEKHGQPLVVGEALISGLEMIQAESGKGVRSIHFVGDEFWKWGEE